MEIIHQFYFFKAPETKLMRLLIFYIEMSKRPYKMTDAEMKEWLETQYDVNENGCWVWKGCKFPLGYGYVRWNGKNEYVHRLYWLLSNRPIKKGFDICHGEGCSRACYNPNHLRTDTHRENVLDRHRHGTMTCKLKPEQVLEIRASTHKTQAILAKEYGVSFATISSIINRKTWTYL